MTRPGAILALVLVAAGLLAKSALAEDLEIGLSSEKISINSSFAGTQVAVFGVVENADPEIVEAGGYDIVVVIDGPPKDVVVRQKQRTAGIWVNGRSMKFGDVPSFYSLAATRPLDQIGDAARRKMLELGAENIIYRSVGGSRELEDEENAQREEFKRSLTRLRASNGLFVENYNAVKFLSPTLFRARVVVPANVPIGYHRARAYLFRDGEFIITRSTLLEVAKSGFEQTTYDLAHRNGLLYGIVAVIIAMLTGWLASVVFRKD